MSGILGKIPKFTLKLPSALAKAGRTMSECPLELSFSLCDERNKAEEEIPLQVKLPLDPEKMTQLEGKEAQEKADEEKSEKSDNMEVTCSVSVDGQEKQEFSFTLYEFEGCDKSNKQDVEKVVVRSICEALGKTLKLPPSGSRTIKVKLAISPDCSKEPDNTRDHANSWPASDPPPTVRSQQLPSKLNDCCSAQSANTTSTYLPSSLSEKPPKYSSPSMLRSPQHSVRTSSCDVRAMPSPKLRPARQHSRLQQRHELKGSLRERIALQMGACDNRHIMNDSLVGYPEDQESRLRFPLSSRDHVPECSDRRNHYLELAGEENPKANDLSQAKNNPEIPNSPRLEPKYVCPCPYRILDRAHNCSSKPHRNGRDSSHAAPSPLKKPSMPSSCHPKLNIDTEGSPKVHHHKVNPDPNDDLLNLNFDLCDLVPDAKFDWEKPHHRRSKSYDLYENDFSASPAAGGLYSPKLKPRNSHLHNWTSILEGQKLSNHLPSSPGHHYRHKHRDRERQRAMQQVANWIAQEHSSSSSKNEATKHFIANSIAPNASSLKPAAAGERVEHHHLHEHVHHHYHHFVEF